MVVKISLIGHRKSGKTNFIRRVMGEIEGLTPHIERKLEVYILQIGLSDGSSVVTKVYDCGSEPPCIGTKEGYHQNADGALVMYGAVGPRLSFLEQRAWQAVGANRARPIVLLDQKILEKPGRDHLKAPFTDLFRLIRMNPDIEVTSLEPI